jgi:acyl carrier protein
MEKELLEFIRKEFAIDPEICITCETKLISEGIIDSFSLVVLQDFIARKYGKKIPAPKITAENFDTIKRMIEVIANY